MWLLAVTATLLVAAGIYDAVQGRVPAPLALLALVAAAAAAIAFHDLQTALLGLAVAAPFLVAWLAVPTLVGGADVKLTAAAALAAGWPIAAGVAMAALAALLAAQTWAQLRRRRAPTVYCAALAVAFLLLVIVV